VAKKRCPSCQGRKYVWKEKLVKDPKTGKVEDKGHQVPCPTCSGSGSV
jgi:endogenous inhibitor of DNA gyrase (YacG/DUF329 family)